MDKLLFTPGPLTTSMTVKEAMLRDLGSRDFEFISLVDEIRNELLKIAGVSKQDGYESVIIQGSGTFGIESVFSTVIPRGGKLLLLSNGAYGRRIASICRIHNINFTEIIYKESETPKAEDVQEAINNDPNISHIAIVHCETTTGIMNDIELIGKIAADRGKSFIVDAMSSFGAVPIDMKELNISYLISSSNKCIEGVPGFSFVLAKHSELIQTKNNARTLSLDLFDQWQGLEKDGQFRFTPPVHALIAFHQALRELEIEGGVNGRADRYSNNHQVLIDGMGKLGFETYLPVELQSYIITSFYYPNWPDARFDFHQFYKLLSDKGFIIYPGKLTQDDCFRIGNIGRLGISEIQGLLDAVQEVCEILKS